MTSEHLQQTALKPVPSVEHVTQPLSIGDLNDLCDATEEAINAGGGFGWIHLPNRNLLERFWQGVLTMPARKLFVARLDNTICGAAQVIIPSKSNEAQSYNVQLSGLFISPWARGQGLSRRLLDFIEKTMTKKGFAIINVDLRETQDAAIQLYESAGYTMIGRHPNYAVVNGDFVAGRYYYKKLQELENIDLINIEDDE
ncbi:MAG TPA: GNAT family N-acetyltransferase [Alphaproteobacteria bacterium]|nr:GNAT family N-acetyltransferase [Alphaproteobacteria bacterium]HOO51999.1 GNAT family N-acetyltransferase [Alphaproteobacteria bacterium]